MTYDIAIAPPCLRTADASGSGLMTRDEPTGSSVSASFTLELRVHAIGYLAETIRSFELRAPGGGALPAVSAGAHIDVALPDAMSRSYSLTNPCGPSDRYVIAVHRDPGSRGGSSFMCETLRVGDLIKVSLPRNTFPLVEDAPASVLIAGGIGITPILGMLARLEELGRDWQLHYAVRSRAQAAFLEELAGYETARSGRVHVHVDAEQSSLLDIAGIVRTLPDETELYCCGPTPMLDAFKEAVRFRPPEKVHFEHFSGTAEKPTGEFKVVLARRKTEFTVPAGRTIMEVLMENGIRVAYSCREGVCGTCETRVLEGIPDHKDNILSPREQASNKLIMICCSGAKSDRLVLDI
ncbi:PDR/VanB family oxidoreductase [Rhizobium binxianense]